MPKVLGLPDVKVGRSKFPRPFKHHMTMNNGDINVLMYDCNITPGDVVEMPISAVVRMQTPLYPVMDNMFFDISVWFVPDRITWKHFKQFWGENDTTFWEEETQYEIPQIEAPTGGWAVGSLADQLGIPTGVEGISTSHQPFRAYCAIWNEFWRDENLKEPIFFNDDETTLTGKNYDAATFDYTTDIQLGACPMKAAKLSDYFTKCLPEPQKGQDVALPLGDKAPVTTKGEENDIAAGSRHPMLFRGTSTGEKITSEWGMLATNEQLPYNVFGGVKAKTQGSETANVEPQSNTWQEMYPTNLAADLSNALGATVNQLRTAIALQRYYEALARSGSRYIEILAGIFGVTSSDKTLQRPQFLAGKRVPINMTQIVATAEGSNNDLGETGAMSQTIINDYLGTFSFEEHGTLMVLGVARHEHTYSQGIPRMLLRKKQTDFYNRAFDHLGEDIVFNAELYAQGTSDDKEVFGYQPRYEDMRLGMSYVSGEFRNDATGSLNSWTYQDNYSELPTLSSDWIDEGVEEVDRTLKITSQLANQLFGDFYFKCNYIRGMSMYGTPGFMDHM